jgi:hypothetical protein
LCSTFGRIVLKNIIISLIKTGLFKKNGPSIPQYVEKIDLWKTLENSAPSDFVGSPIRDEYDELLNEYRIIISSKINYIGTSLTSSPFITKTISVNGLNREYPHLISEINSKYFIIPLSESVIYENMARQIQRDYLYFNNNLDTSLTDGYAINDNEIIYICINRHLKKVIPSTESISKWTITLCQIAMLCRHPGEALTYILKKLETQKIFDLVEFEKSLQKDTWFSGEYNVPNVQTVVSDLIEKYGIYIQVTEHYELTEFLKKLVDISNHVNSNKQYFYDPLLKWDGVKIWLELFGCPSLFCGGTEISSLHGVKTNTYWFRYFDKVHQLLV